MQAILNRMSPDVRNNLRTQMHKVAAAMMERQGIPIARDEITIKEAAYLIGRNAFLHRQEKQAMLSGIMSVRQLGG